MNEQDQMKFDLIIQNLINYDQSSQQQKKQEEQLNEKTCDIKNQYQEIKQENNSQILNLNQTQNNEKIHDFQQRDHSNQIQIEENKKEYEQNDEEEDDNLKLQQLQILEEIEFEQKNIQEQEIKEEFQSQSQFDSEKKECEQQQILEKEKKNEEKLLEEGEIEDEEEEDQVQGDNQQKIKNSQNTEFDQCSESSQIYENFQNYSENLHQFPEYQNQQVQQTFYDNKQSQYNPLVGTYALQYQFFKQYQQEKELKEKEQKNKYKSILDEESEETENDVSQAEINNNKGIQQENKNRQTIKLMSDQMHQNKDQLIKNCNIVNNQNLMDSQNIDIQNQDFKSQNQITNFSSDQKQSPNKQIIQNKKRKLNYDNCQDIEDQIHKKHQISYDTVDSEQSFFNNNNEKQNLNTSFTTTQKNQNQNNNSIIKLNQNQIYDDILLSDLEEIIMQNQNSNQIQEEQNNNKQYVQQELDSNNKIKHLSECKNDEIQYHLEGIRQFNFQLQHIEYERFQKLSQLWKFDLQKAKKQNNNQQKLTQNIENLQQKIEIQKKMFFYVFMTLYTYLEEEKKKKIQRKELLFSIGYSQSEYEKYYDIWNSNNHELYFSKNDKDLKHNIDFKKHYIELHFQQKMKELRQQKELDDLKEDEYQLEQLKKLEYSEIIKKIDPKLILNNNNKNWSTKTKNQDPNNNFKQNVYRCMLKTK
ncbi:hypothetical protein PPERSA_04875 [Pseudocohnilembus persalinus]|uniref:Uncharacterized protein n=1 Tax=Pseudocohnilembus persalinus TaxID=266149 RepID=A0A0V0QJ27_PSEPJ|nr:hypothetical protein PPERSA_04875 [Pseudocohnilembus persalinus]|eukprot:KRX02253.1 hypothetical protein PPERSA_04875 [Pseudocohnilembus persalinus]